jgi:hypothetical protein
MSVRALPAERTVLCETKTLCCRTRLINAGKINKGPDGKALQVIMGTNHDEMALFIIGLDLIVPHAKLPIANKTAYEVMTHLAGDTVGWWLLAARCWLLLLVVGCWLLVVGCWLLVVGCWLLVFGFWLLLVAIHASVPSARAVHSSALL